MNAMKENIARNLLKKDNEDAVGRFSVVNRLTFDESSIAPRGHQQQQPQQDRRGSGRPLSVMFSTGLSNDSKSREYNKVGIVYKILIIPFIPFISICYFMLNIRDQVLTFIWEYSTFNASIIPKPNIRNDMLLKARGLGRMDFFKCIAYISRRYQFVALNVVAIIMAKEKPEAYFKLDEFIFGRGTNRSLIIVGQIVAYVLLSYFNLSRSHKIRNDLTGYMHKILTHTHLRVRDSEHTILKNITEIEDDIVGKGFVYFKTLEHSDIILSTHMFDSIKDTRLNELFSDNFFRDSEEVIFVKIDNVYNLRVEHKHFLKMSILRNRFMNHAYLLGHYLWNGTKLNTDITMNDMRVYNTISFLLLFFYYLTSIYLDHNFYLLFVFWLLAFVCLCIGRLRVCQYVSVREMDSGHNIKKIYLIAPYRDNRDHFTILGRLKEKSFLTLFCDSKMFHPVYGTDIPAETLALDITIKISSYANYDVIEHGLLLRDFLKLVSEVSTFTKTPIVVSFRPAGDPRSTMLLKVGDSGRDTKYVHLIVQRDVNTDEKSWFFNATKWTMQYTNLLKWVIRHSEFTTSLHVAETPLTSDEVNSLWLKDKQLTVQQQHPQQQQQHPQQSVCEDSEEFDFYVY